MNPAGRHQVPARGSQRRFTIRPYFAPCWHLSVTAGRNDAPPRRRPGVPERRGTRVAGDAARNAVYGLLLRLVHLVAEVLDLFPEVLDLPPKGVAVGAVL